jgi:WD40 repeat protein
MLSGHSDTVNSVSSGIVDSSGRQLLASASKDRTICVWDAVTGECVRELKGHSGEVECVTGGFVDGSSLHCIASTSLDCALRVWDVGTGATVHVVSLNEQMGFSCPRNAGCMSFGSSGDKCRLVVAAGRRLAIVEYCS